MARKITPSPGGWRKRFGVSDQHRSFEQSASRELADILTKGAVWRDLAIRKLTAPLARRPLAPNILSAFRACADQLIELETPVVPADTTGSRELLEAVAYRR